MPQRLLSATTVAARVTPVTSAPRVTPPQRRTRPSRSAAPWKPGANGDREGRVRRRWGGGLSVDDAVEAVAGVAEAGDDVGLLVESLVHGGGDDLHLAAPADRLLHGPHA